MTAPARSTDLYRARKGRVELVDVPELLLVAVDGRGSPDGPDFAAAIQALYSVSSGAHVLLRKQDGAAPKGMPLEALWWVDDAEARDTFTALATGAISVDDVDRALWRWRALITQPEPITEAVIAEAVRSKAPALADRVQITRWREGLAAQILHIGPYSTEGPSIVALHDGIAALGLRPRGRHHEIYLGDPRRGAPEKLRTLLRHPVE